MIWKSTALLGLVALLVGIGAFFLDLASRFRFDFIEDHYDAFALAAIFRVLTASIGLIGWAGRLRKTQRNSLLGVVIAFPVAVALVGYLIDGLNVHGTAGAVLCLFFASIILGIVLRLYLWICTTEVFFHGSLKVGFSETVRIGTEKRASRQLSARDWCQIATGLIEIRQYYEWLGY